MTAHWPLSTITLIIVGWFCVFPYTGTAQASSFFKTKAADGSVVFSDVRPGQPRRYKNLGKRPSKSSGKSSYRCVAKHSQEMESRLAKIEPVIAKYAEEFKINKHLVKAIARVESCFDHKAVSRAGAQGLMQLMPGTAKIYGVRNAFDINQNIRAGINYFADLHAEFESDLKLTLAAYNAGPGAVNQHQGIPPYPETQKYVVKVLKTYQEYARPNAQ